MVDEVLKDLVTNADGVYIDGTVGAGGHAEAILGRLDGKGKILGIDRDQEILEVARKRITSPQALFLHGTFDELDVSLRSAADFVGSGQVDGIFLDLGVSSYQFDVPERGFSFGKEARLDMRMDPRADEPNAEDILRTSSARDLEVLLREYGEEPFARRIAAAVVEARRKKNLATTTELAELVARAVPRRAWPRRIHPATRTFQALRIAVNRELERLDHFLESAPTFLKPNGRLAVISYHSLEDRRVKQSFVRFETEGILRRVTKKPLTATDEEIAENPRARSAKLRVAEKVGGSR